MSLSGIWPEISSSPDVFIHRYRGDGRLMIVYQPAGAIEQFFLDGSRLANPSPADLQAHYRTHGLEIVGPPLNLDDL